jgi:hypothetical protein
MTRCYIRALAHVIQAKLSVMGGGGVERLVREVRAALRRRSAHEAKLAGTLRAVSAHAPELSRELLVAVETVARRGSFERPLYGCAVRALSEQGDSALIPVLAEILSAADAGGLSSLCAACFTKDASLREPLARVALSRHPVLAFAAEVARLSRGEARGSQIAALAPKIKEAHRLALCSELFVSLLSRKPLPVEIAPALAVLRDTERHLGRWLLLGELATRAGDPQPLQEAMTRAKAGAESARAAWSLVAWALDGRATSPTAKLSVELIARLSDRPSAERDATFLFRLAAARVPGAKPMLESFARSEPLRDQTLRAALHLCRDYAQEHYLELLGRAGRSPRQDALRGLAVAALYDCGQTRDALGMADELERSRQLPALGWALLVRATASGGRSGRVVSELNFRRVQQGACE